MHRVLGLLVLIASFGGGWLWMDYREFERTPLDLPADGPTYTLPQGGSAGSLASDLVAAGYLPARWEPYLRWMAWTSGRAAQLQAGEYRLAPGLTASGLLDLLVSGKVVQYPLTIIEGWTFRQLMAAVREHPALRQTLTHVDEKPWQRTPRKPLETPWLEARDWGSRTSRSTSCGRSRTRAWCSPPGSSARRGATASRPSRPCSAARSSSARAAPRSR